MNTVQIIHTFLKDPLTEKLMRRYLPSGRARKMMGTAVQIVEIAMLIMPLIDAARRNISDSRRTGGTRQRSSNGGQRRLAAQGSSDE